MRNVLFYSNLLRLKELSFYKDIQSFPIISDSSELAEKLKELELFTESSVSINQVISELFPDWRNKEERFAQLIFTKEIIHRFELNCTDEKKRLFYEGCRKNAFDIISAIYVFVEAQLTPDDIPEMSDESMILLKKVWIELENNSDSFKFFRRNSKELEDKSFFENCLISLFGKSKFDCIIFHCFFYLTPIQEYVIRLFEKHGYNVIMLGASDKNHKAANEIWEFTYKKKFGYVSKEQWIYGDYVSNYSPFAELVDGNSIELKNKIELKEYSSVISFERDLKKYSSIGWHIVSPDPKKSNEILSNFYPEKYPERSLRTYPIGQFLYSIHSLWDEELDTIVLDKELLRICFSSGWVDNNDHDSREYLSDLESILPYFENCITSDDWDCRLDELADVMNNAVYTLDSNSGSEVERWENLLGNPLRNFSMFAIDPERLNDVSMIIRNIILMAKDLFGAGGKIDVNSHMKKLERYLTKDHPAENHYREENNVMKKIIQKVSSFNKKGLTCYPSDMLDAIMLYLDDQLGDDEDREIDFVDPLFKAEPESLCKNGKIHICLCDNERMPGKGGYAWPLNNSIIEKIYNHVSKKDPLTLVNQMMLTIDGRPLYRRYLMALLLRNPDVTISWISEMDRKGLSPSPYVEIINDMLSVPIEKVYAYELAEHSFDGLSREKFSELINLEIPELSMEHALCMHRYVYGYVLKERPVFTDTFSQQFAVTELIRAISKITGMGTSVVKKNVLKIFNNYLDIQKIQMSDFVGSSNSEDADSILSNSTKIRQIDKSFTNQRLRVLFSSPKGEVLDKAVSYYLHPELKHNLIDPVVCRYCPHRGYCIYSKLE